MKILYSGLRYNYGKQAEGASYEHMNVEAGLREYCINNNIELDLYYPDVHSNLQDNYLPEIISGNYSLIFHVAFNEHLDLPEGFAKLALKHNIPVAQFDSDSSWRFESWILPRKNRVSHFITTHSATIPWYQQNRMRVIKSQWGGSPLYKNLNLEKIYDASFVAQKHGIRPQILQALYAANIRVDLFGNYWDGYPNWHGYLTDYNDVIRVFNQSKICLNLSNPWHVNTMSQIKGRHYEIPQCGAFQLSTPADDLESYFVHGKEIVIANNINELINAIKHYLEHDDEREEIARAGYERTLRDHSWFSRFDHIFKEIGIV